jgi:predicted nucleic acid-binding protein
VALAWALPDEGRKDPARGLLASLTADQPAMIPVHWSVEVGNGLLMALRRGRLDQVNLLRAMAELSLLPLAVDDRGAREAWTEPFAQALSRGLTLYDALYLELAKRQGMPLGTFDAALRHAAIGAGVAVLP